MRVTPRDSGLCSTSGTAMSMPEDTLQLPASVEPRETCADGVTDAKDVRRLNIKKKQVADMQAFWSLYAGQDQDLVAELCREFEQYTVDSE